MTFSIHIGWWLLPVILTAGLWIYLHFKFPPRQMGTWDFGLDYVIAFLLGVSGTLFIWLIYVVALLIFRQ